jgi:hypothetical protein
MVLVRKNLIQTTLRQIGRQSKTTHTGFWGHNVTGKVISLIAPQLSKWRMYLHLSRSGDLASFSGMQILMKRSENIFATVNAR